MQIIQAPSSQRVLSNNGVLITCDVLAIGAWDMDAANSKQVVHTINLDDIVGVEIIIRDDAGGIYYPCPYPASGANNEMSFQLGTGVVTMTRLGAGIFDAVTFNDTGISRGNVIIWYKL